MTAGLIKEQFEDFAMLVWGEGWREQCTHEQAKRREGDFVTAFARCFGVLFVKKRSGKKLLELVLRLRAELRTYAVEFQGLGHDHENN